MNKKQRNPSVNDIRPKQSGWALAFCRALARHVGCEVAEKLRPSRCPINQRKIATGIKKRHKKVKISVAPLIF